MHKTEHEPRHRHVLSPGSPPEAEDEWALPREPDHSLQQVFLEAITNTQNGAAHPAADLLREAENAHTAHTLFEMCAKVAGGCLNDYGPLDWYCPDCDLQRYLDQGLLQLHDQ